MPENDFVTYQISNDTGEANELAELLTANNIEFLFEDTSLNFDPSFAFNSLKKEFRIKLKKQDFDKADKVLSDISARQLDGIDEDYYLFEFSNPELFEVISMSDEWSKLDYLLAQKILKDRGQEVNEVMIEALKKQRIEELAKPEQGLSSLITTGYVFAFLGGIIGMFIGWHLLSSKKTLPNGDRVYGYSLEDRKQGKNILILGTIFLVIWIIIKIVFSDKRYGIF